MRSRAVLLTSVLAVALILPFSVVALASPPTAPAPAPVTLPDPPTIAATGSATFGTNNPDAFLTLQTLFIAAQSKAGPADVDVALTEMQSRLIAIRAALERLGLPRTGIRFQGINVQPLYGPPGPGTPSSVDKGQALPQQVLSFTITANMQAEVADPKLLVPALNAATANGATTVNSGGGKSGPLPVQPPADALAQGTAEALANAKLVAGSIASATGQKLGAIRSVSAPQLYPVCCPQGGTWQINLTVTFDTVP